jgi:hypothetical protein
LFLRTGNVMQKFRDIFLGKRIWVLGCGPSLCEIDFDKIPEDDVILACNSSVMKTDRYNYACFTDGVVPFFEYYHKIPLEKIISFNQDEVKAGHYIKKCHDIKFTKSDEYVCFGIDITHCTTHLAYMMGAREIMLAGCDCYVDKDIYHWNNKEKIETTTTDNIPISLKQNLKENHSYKFGAELGYWDKIYANNPKLPITIVSPNSRIRHFPKKSFNEVI